MATVIGERMATLRELMTVYDSEDMLLMWEAAMVTAYNKS
ncbi:hypothetical protein GKA01_10900 [Gluconobacter kanchanaburiensis NBRC 103587]|uniref:Uncharacterized protein n=1 Tax=Gluconobacter kanchanaburiensis NBRC 103587 TaxID=1307948 RepID=A0A511B8A4_9PROT|nr:hypothetical protein AA103587_2170 [Gluconobacter kanchanaburiensis NBRC 103587]GEK95893.1 hypothetical protein GKA01_10900 [Gluconobacter kanchanaburiensis NBRC 103587]